MAVSVRLDPLMEKELELSAKRQGITKSQFIIAALERALGRKDPYKLLMQIKAQYPEAENLKVEELNPDLSNAKEVIRAKLRAKHEANQQDWLAYQHAKKQGKAWPVEQAKDIAS